MDLYTDGESSDDDRIVRELCQSAENDGGHPDAAEWKRRGLKPTKFDTVFADHGDEEKEKKKKKNKKPKKRSEMSDKKRRFEGKKESLKTEAEERMFHRDCATRTLLKVDTRQTLYAETTWDADVHASLLIEAMEIEQQPFYYLGFDSEGVSTDPNRIFVYNVFQIYAVIGTQEFQLLFQLNFIEEDGAIPPKLFQLFDDPRTVFVGKEVQKEVASFLRQYNFSSARQNRFHFIDVLTPVRVADTFARPSIDDALEYVTRFVFRTNTDVPMGIDAKAFQNAGLRSALHYFTNYTIDKRKCHVHPRLVDYSRTRNHPVSKNQMTSD